jgi:hypothetical protein
MLYHSGNMVSDGLADMENYLCTKEKHQNIFTSENALFSGESVLTWYHEQKLCARGKVLKYLPLQIKLYTY